MVNHSPFSQHVVVLTRPVERQSDLMAQLGRLKVDVLSLPALRIEPVTLTAARLSEATTPPYDLIVFVSRAAVEPLSIEQLQSLCHDQTVWATVGSQTAQAIHNKLASMPLAHRTVVWPMASDTQDSEGLWRALGRLTQPVIYASSPESVVRPLNTLILRGDKGRQWLMDQLTQQGHRVDVLSVYQTHVNTWSASHCATLRTLTNESKRLIWLLTSQQSIHAIAQQLNLAGIDPRQAVDAFLVTHPKLVEGAQAFIQKSVKNASQGGVLEGQTPYLVVQPNVKDMVQAIQDLIGLNRT